jgi:hypothetical protein
VALRTAVWQSSGSLACAVATAIRTPAQASANPYAAAHTTSTGTRIVPGPLAVSTTAKITGMTATAVPDLADVQLFDRHHFLEAGLQLRAVQRLGGEQSQKRVFYRHREVTGF